MSENDLLQAFEICCAGGQATSVIAQLPADGS